MRKKAKSLSSIKPNNSRLLLHVHKTSTILSDYHFHQLVISVYDNCLEVALYSRTYSNNEEQWLAELLVVDMAESKANFLQQFRDAQSKQFKRITATQFMDVWNHYDTVTRQIFLFWPLKAQNFGVLHPWNSRFVLDPPWRFFWRRSCACQFLLVLPYTCILCRLSG